MKNKNSAQKKKLDPFTYEIIKRGIGGACREMFFAFGRAARSPIIYNAKDYGGGIATGNGELVMQTTGIPTFLGILDFSVKDLVRERKDIRDGDIFITNVVYHGGTHISDVSLFMPLFVHGNLDFFITLKGHWTDIGGMTPGSGPWNASEVYQEGLLFRNLRIARKDRLDPEMVELIRSNSRTPELTIGDLYAQVGAMRIARNRMRDLYSKYGQERMIETTNRILKEGQMDAKQYLSKLPHGKWVMEDYIDNPISGRKPIKIKVQLTINKDKFKADFTGSSPQVNYAAINSSYSKTVSAVREAFMAITDPHHDPSSGFFSLIEVVAPEGLILHAVPPAATSATYESSSYATDVIWHALAKHIPEKLSAGHFLALYVRHLSGIDDTSPEKKFFIQVGDALGGGWGASYDSDGESAVVSIIDGETYNMPCEVGEKLHPVRVERFTLNTEDRIPRGKFRGGFGVIKDLRILCSEVKLDMSFNRSGHPPWGMSGGETGTPNYALVSGSVNQRVTGHTNLNLKRGDVISMRTGCGGGWGDPSERTKEQIEYDLNEGYITTETAKQWLSGIKSKKNVRR